MSYWNWWQGALALALVGQGFCRLLGRPMGVSGYLRRLVHWREELEVERREQAALADREALRQALLEATLQQFGPEALANLPPATKERPRPAIPSRLPLVACALFLAGILLGGWLSAVLRGVWQPQLSLGQDFQRLVAHGLWAPLVLFAGGCLVGGGTAMAGGCTSGHGLSGCSRLQPGSLAATATFMGVAMLVSLLLDRCCG